MQKAIVIALVLMASIGIALLSAWNHHYVDVGSFRTSTRLKIFDITVFQRMYDNPEFRWASSIRPPRGEHWMLIQGEPWFGNGCALGGGRRFFYAAWQLCRIATTNPALAKQLLQELDSSPNPMKSDLEQRISQAYTIETHVADQAK